MNDIYATEDKYTVALVTAGAIETAGNQHDQLVTTDSIYKGQLDATDTVTFTYDETWNYLCAGSPAADGAQAVYVLQDNIVMQSYTPDSELAQSLIATIDTPPNQPTPVTEKESLMQQVIVLLQKLIALLTPDATPTVPATTLPTAIDYTGMDIAEAAQTAQANNTPFRVVATNGELLPITKDLQEGRINATVENGLVVSYTIESSNGEDINQPQPTPGSHDSILGITSQEAADYAETQNIPFRVGTIDGEPMPVTMDYRPGRITAEVQNDIVVDYTVE